MPMSFRISSGGWRLRSVVEITDELCNGTQQQYIATLEVSRRRGKHFGDAYNDVVSRHHGNNEQGTKIKLPTQFGIDSQIVFRVRERHNVSRAVAFAAKTSLEIQLYPNVGRVPMAGVADHIGAIAPCDRCSSGPSAIGHALYHHL